MTLACYYLTWTPTNTKSLGTFFLAFFSSRMKWSLIARRARSAAFRNFWFILIFFLMVSSCFPINWSHLRLPLMLVPNRRSWKSGKMSVRFGDNSLRNTFIETTYAGKIVDGTSLVPVGMFWKILKWMPKPWSPRVLIMAQIVQALHNLDLLQVVFQVLDDLWGQERSMAKFKVHSHQVSITKQPVAQPAEYLWRRNCLRVSHGF